MRGLVQGVIFGTTNLLLYATYGKQQQQQPDRPQVDRPPLLFHAWLSVGTSSAVLPWPDLTRCVLLPASSFRPAVLVRRQAGVQGHLHLPGDVSEATQPNSSSRRLPVAKDGGDAGRPHHWCHVELWQPLRPCVTGRPGVTSVSAGLLTSLPPPSGLCAMMVPTSLQDAGHHVDPHGSHGPRAGRTTSTTRPDSCHDQAGAD